jgi:cyclopropane fatty-acyl-phospholipid synthase-like methyltransferase
MTIDYFAHKAGSYEKDQDRVDNVQNIADAIRGAFALDRSMHLMDFGSGTGLLLERLAPHAGKITAVDVSPSMHAQLRAKQATLGCALEIVETDLEVADLDRTFDGIVSSMTMHHIKNIDAMFGKFHAMLRDGGFVAIADLDLEDGSFHSEDTGVHHFGFDRALFAQSAAAAGFRMVNVSSASVVQKSSGHYPVFLLTGVR